MIYLYETYDIRTEESEWDICEGEPSVSHSGQSITNVIAIDSGSIEKFDAQYQDDAEAILADNYFRLAIFSDDEKGTWMEEHEKAYEIRRDFPSFVRSLNRELSEVIADWIVSSIEEHACMEERGTTLSDFDEHNVWNKSQLGLS